MSDVTRILTDIEQGNAKATTTRWWTYARAWLFNEIQSKPH